MFKSKKEKITSKLKKADKKIPNGLKEYLIDRLDSLTIEICAKEGNNIIDLQNCGELEGWCWQTTGSAILFMNDFDYVERGYLDIGEPVKYYHSWIKIFYNGKQYVYDPSLNYLCRKSDYYKIFNVQLKGRICARSVKNEFKTKILYPKQSINNHNKFISVNGNDDINSAMFRNNSGYKAQIEDGEIKEVIAHYYMNG